MIFLFDEQLPPKVAQALDSVEQGARSVTSEGLRGATDEEVIKYAGDNGWYFVSSNTDILRKPQERAAIAEFGVGAYFFTGRANRDQFDWLELTVRRWRDMKTFAESAKVPFVASIPDRGAIRLHKGRRIRRPKG